MTALLRRLLELHTWRAFDVSSDGRVLAGHDGSGSVQLVEVTNGDVRALTALPGACSGRYLGPDTIVVQHDEGGDENWQLSLLDLDRDAPAGLADLRPLVRAPGVMNTLLDVLPDRVVYSTNRRNRVDFDVVVHDVATGEETVVWDGGGMTSEVTVSDAGRAAVSVVSDVAMSAWVLLVEPDGSRRDLTPRAEPGRHEGLAWLPDGRLAVTTDRDRDTTAVIYLDVDTGDREIVAEDAAYDVTGWPSPDGVRLLVETSVDGQSQLPIRSASGVTRVELPGAGVCSFPMPAPRWAPDSGFAVLSFSAPGVPADILLLDAAAGALSQVADSTQALAGLQLVEPDSTRVPTGDGERVPCFVYRPTSPTGSAVLIIHGGPEGQSTRTFNPIVQALVGEGHTVLVPNVRGSTGYGRRWYSLDDGPLRLNSVEDLAALHDFLPTIGVDPTRAALWGGSYGGYMVLAGLAFQPERWAAGVDIVGISSLVTFLENTSPYRRAAREREYGWLATDRAMLEAASPLSRIDDIRAPVLAIHGANDPRVPLSEAQQLQASLTERGVPCDLLVYDDEGHGLAKRPNRLDAYPKALAFLAEHLST